MKKQNGLTLIEVLIASLLLFLSLGVVATVFQQSFMTQAQAEKYMNQLADYQSLLAEIRFQLEQQSLTGEISTPSGAYRWRAVAEKRGQELSSISLENFEASGGAGQLVLYRVEVEFNDAIIFEVKQAVWHLNAA
jgi:Tfp pilus assembly protein PilV